MTSIKIGPQFYEQFEQRIDDARPPVSRELTRDELQSLRPDQIETLKDYFRSTFPEEFSKDNYLCLETVRRLTIRIVSQLQPGDVVLAPGDSPYKLVRVMNLVYDLPSIRFVTFPLSGLGHFYRENEVEQYLRTILIQNGIGTPNQLKILDFSWSGASFELMTNLLRKIFNQPGLQVPLINIRLPHTDYCLALLDDLFAVAENLQSRCTPEYYLKDGLQLEPVDQISQARCAVVIAILSLYLQGRL